MSKYIKGNMGIVKKDLIKYIYVTYNETYKMFLIRAKIESGLLSDLIVIGRYKNEQELDSAMEKIYVELENNKKHGDIWGYVRNKLGVKKNGSIHIFKL